MSDSQKNRNGPKSALSPDANKALNEEEKAKGLAVLESVPLRVSMNMTGKCNIRCVYCHLTFNDYFTRDELGVETFERLAPFLPSLSHLVYFSSTEPLAARHFKDVFQYSGDYPAEKYLSTNALLLDEETSRMFVEGHLAFLTISVAGLTRDSFKTAHQVDQLDLLIENIETLNRFKDAAGAKHPRLRLVFVTWRDNAHELPEAVRFAHRHRFSEGIKISYLKLYGDTLTDQLPFEHQEEVNRWVAEAQKIGEELGVPVTFDGGNFADLGEEHEVAFHRPCMEPFERFHIEADGKVRCCPALVNNVFAGNLNEQSAWEIWNGPVYQDFRRRTNSDDPPEPCRNCTHNVHKDFRRPEIWDQRDLDLSIYNRRKGRPLLKRKKPEDR